MDPNTEDHPLFRHSWSMKLIATLVGALCLGLAFLAVMQIQAASVSQIHPAGGGCSESQFNGVSLKMCIAVKGDNVVSDGFVNTVNGSACPNSVSVLLQDKFTAHMPVSTHGCGHFRGPTLFLASNNIYLGHVDACFGINCAGQASPFLNS